MVSSYQQLGAEWEMHLERQFEDWIEYMDSTVPMRVSEYAAASGRNLDVDVIPNYASGDEIELVLYEDGKVIGTYYDDDGAEKMYEDIELLTGVIL